MRKKIQKTSSNTLFKASLTVTFVYIIDTFFLPLSLLRNRKTKHVSALTFFSFLRVYYVVVSCDVLKDEIIAVNNNKCWAAFDVIRIVIIVVGGFYSRVIVHVRLLMKNLTNCPVFVFFLRVEKGQNNSFVFFSSVVFERMCLSSLNNKNLSNDLFRSLLSNLTLLWQ